ncbi:MAG: prenyltransferase/squalene oxidase repeat-containing protein [Thermoguttaceae bacterium]
MAALYLGRLWSLLTGTELVMALLWLGLATFTVALVVLIWTRWGQYRPLRKCLVLSILAHLLLAGYATTVRIVALVPPADVPIAYIEGPAGRGAEGDDPAGVVAAPEARRAAAETSPPLLAIPSQPTPPVKPASPPPAATLDPPPPPVAAVLDKPTAMADPAAGPGDPLQPAGPPDEPVSTAATAADRTAAAVAPWPSESGGAPPSALAASASAGPPAQPMPDVYRLRMVPNHARLAEGHGGSPETEAAVQAALQWLADNQSADGHWSARQHEAGRETPADGRDRQHAGLHADSAMTALALLAFLGSGETHRDGPHREAVRRGLEYLLSVEGGDGNLSGQTDIFARMYSHAMAAFALSEAYAMTGDGRLRDGVGRAVAYTLAAQDAAGGGWRYRPGDPGDTSQLGWQWMALKSADLAGIRSGEPARQGIMRFLRSVSSGDYGGLASYRPGEQATRTMTAEALVCWQFLGMAREDPASNEAGDFLLGQLPGQGAVNVYYWYYGTLAMYQLQGEYWRRWNQALQTQLLGSQRKAGALAGSWDPDATWGGYGGRIYSTSLSALCLEVYYRFLPLYSHVGNK